MFDIKKRLSEATDMPISSFGVCPYIGIEGNETVTVYETEELLEYGEEKTSLRLHGMTVTVTGSGIQINSYGGGTVKLSGKITELAFTDIERPRGDRKC